MFINIIGIKHNLSIVWQRGGQIGKTGSTYPSTTSEKFMAPTTEMEGVLFTTGTNEDAANFLETKKRLARYVGTFSYRGAATASLVIETMTNPTFTTASRPKKPNFKKKSGDKVDDLTEQMLILEYSVKIAKYIKDQKETRIEDRDWKENEPEL